MNAIYIKRFVVLAAFFSLVSAPALATLNDVTAGGEIALDLCHRSGKVPSRAADMLKRGMRLAEAAVAADESDPRARFALFCILGKQLKSGGIGIGSVSKVRRLRREIDIAHQLAPDDPDILAAKGALLVELPGIFGGDVIEGERLLRRSLSIRGANRRARVYLAMALEAQGLDAEASAGAASSYEIVQVSR